MCRDCYGAQRGGKGRAGSASDGRNATKPDLDLESGVFTDGSCSGNSGPGGWGAVWVENDTSSVS